MNNESFYMHPKYQEFLGSIKNLESDARITPNALNLAFDVWLLRGGNMGESQIEWLKAENARLTKENEQLMKDVHRIDSARQAAVSQCSAMAEKIEQLNDELMQLKRNIAIALDYGSISERGHACMSIDGGNL